MNFRTVVAAVALLATRVSALEASDVVALQKQKQWSELLAKAGDVAPSSRDQAWNDAVEAAALAELSRLQRMQRTHENMATVDGWLTRYVHLASSPRVVEARRQLAAKAWGDCMEAGEVDWCAEQLVSWSRAAPLGGAGLVEAAKKLGYPEHSARVALVSEALRVEPASVRCDDAQMGESLVAVANRSASKKDVDAVVAGCGAKLGKPSIAKLLDDPDGLKRFCPRLLASGLSGVQKARCERGGAK